MIPLLLFSLALLGWIIIKLTTLEKHMSKQDDQLTELRAGEATLAALITEVGSALTTKIVDLEAKLASQPLSIDLTSDIQSLKDDAAKLASFAPAPEPVVAAALPSVAVGDTLGLPPTSDPSGLPADHIVVGINADGTILAQPVSGGDVVNVDPATLTAS